MTKDDVIRMARVAGVRDDGHRFEFSDYRYLERFAALVAAQEREECAKVCDERAKAWESDPPDTQEQVWDWRHDEAEYCAGSIRARGNA